MSAPSAWEHFGPSRLPAGPDTLQMTPKAFDAVGQLAHHLAEAVRAGDTEALALQAQDILNAEPAMLRRVAEWADSRGILDEILGEPSAPLPPGTSKIDAMEVVMAATLVSIRDVFERQVLRGNLRPESVHRATSLEDL